MTTTDTMPETDPRIDRLAQIVWERARTSAISVAKRAQLGDEADELKAELTQALQRPSQDELAAWANRNGIAVRGNAWPELFALACGPEPKPKARPLRQKLMRPCRDGACVECWLYEHMMPSGLAVCSHDCHKEASDD